MSYKDEAKRSRDEKARRIVGAAHGGSVSRGEAKHIADAAVNRHKRHAYHLGPEEIAKDVKKDVKKDCYARGGRTKKGGKGDVNIIIDTAPKGALSAPVGTPPTMPPRPAAPPPAPPMPPPGAMPSRPGMPPGGAPPMPMRATGGAVKMKAGAGSGEGRLEKIGKRPA